MAVTLPAEAWVDMAETYSAKLAAEFRGPPPEPVRARPFQGQLYTSYAAVYGHWDGRSWGRIEAWRLVPESLWDGETIPSYRDAGRDKTGLRVRFRNKIWICAEPVEFLASLPEGILPLEAAHAYDANCQSGWRRLWFRNPEITWHSLTGHPVVRYQEGDRLATVLLWRYRGCIQETWVHPNVELEAPVHTGASTEEQLSLF